jgi:polyferredoxin
LDRYLPGWGGAEIFCLGVYAAWVGSLMRDPARARRVRPRIWALFSFVFFAQLGLGLAGLDEMLMTGRLHLPVPALIIGGPLYRGGGLFMPLLFGGAVLLAGPAWCSHLCYIGAWDDRMSRLGKTAPQAESASSWAWGRWATLGLVVITALGLRLAGVSGPVAVWLGAGFGLAGVGVMVLVSRRRGVMAHCAAWCPMGLVAALLGRINPFRVRLGEGCTGCGACARACRYGALDEARIDSRRPGPGCTLCGDCVGACPRGSAGYAFPGLGPRAARELFLLVVITLHAVFLGVARI